MVLMLLCEGHIWWTFGAITFYNCGLDWKPLLEIAMFAMGYLTVAVKRVRDTKYLESVAYSQEWSWKLCSKNNDNAKKPKQIM